MKFYNVRLLVNDMKTSMAFYRDTLGFEAQFNDPDEAYAEMAVGEGVTLALFGREAMAQAVGAAHRPSSAEHQDKVALIFGVEDVDAVAAQLRAKGVTLEAEPQDRAEWMMRTAHFRDPDGNLIEINKWLPNPQV